MNIGQELEAMRIRIIQEINTEFDRLIQQAAGNAELETQSESAYPLTAGTGIFKGKKPVKVFTDGQTPLYITTWKQLVAAVLQECVTKEGSEAALRQLCGNISGKKRVLLDRTPRNMRSPLQIAKDLYMETHYDTETLLNILTKRILDPIGYDYSRILVVIRGN